MIKILHNPRCGKSREGLSLLEETGNPFEVIKYLDNPLAESQLTELVKKLNIAPLDLIRQKEKIWIEQFKGKELTDAELIKAIANNPILMERPIVISENKAVIGRPPQKIIDFLKK
ncbi:arsenate reductase (glutaredoxin) [Flavobacterium piscinae]|uniref:Arsenate reductase (Glutaredoxin) n=1 Tax=Flavobacterium piscinae TaxID=2506424 RepID=A0A4V1N4I3_9FLAO|nr:arsenate reductase (glutaredoxin) [Flavobacterium piscinae]MBC8882768.1 arsenate reductase (glutaredoxin) [Flavobacterium piscinae]RXR32266.1 arsenate reductase (glutaredoxin) [Flavobacterium piscinae]